MTSTATAPALPASLRAEEPHRHTAKGGVTYTLTPLTYVHDDGTEEVAGVLVNGDPHRLCKRCGDAFGFYSFNGEDSDCYECGREGYGADDSAENLARLARNRVMTRLRAAAKIAREDAEREAALAAWKDANADLVEALAPYAPKVDEWGTLVPAKGFLGDIAATLAVRALSERQAEAVRKVLADKAAKVVVECPEGRIVIEGKIIGVKEVDDNFSYYGGTIFKMTVADDRGFRVFGTVPSSVEVDVPEGGTFAEALKGVRVRFTGTVERSAKDADFGFFKRPAKAEVLPA